MEAESCRIGFQDREDTARLAQLALRIDCDALTSMEDHPHMSFNDQQSTPSPLMGTTDAEIQRFRNRHASPSRLQLFLFWCELERNGSASRSVEVSRERGDRSR